MNKYYYYIPNNTEPVDSYINRDHYETYQPKEVEVEV